MKRHWDNFQAVRGAKVADFKPISFQCDKKTALLPNQFTLLVWNIYKRNGGHAFDQDLSLLSQRSHVKCLQEVLAKRSGIYVHEEIQDLHHHYAVSYQRSDDFFEGVLTVSPYVMRQECFALKSIGREPITQTPKSALITLHELQNGQTLLLINIHMLLFKHTRLFRRELQQVLALCENYRHFPAIFCGDFNTFMPWQLKLLDLYLYKSGFHRAKPSHKANKGAFLDHVYYRALKLEKMEVIDSITSSDHYPILCQLSCE